MKPGPRKQLTGEKRVVVKLEPTDRAVLQAVAVERYAAGDSPGLTSAVRFLCRQEAKRREHARGRS